MKKPIRISEDTHNLLDIMKDKYSYSNYDTCVNTMATFVLKNNINPKDNFAGDFRSELRNLEDRLVKVMDKAHTKITKDNATLRSWVGGITKDHLVPITNKLNKIYNLKIDTKIEEKVETTKDINPLNSHLYKSSNEDNMEVERLKKMLTEKEDKVREYYTKYSEVREVLFNIFNNYKVEQGGMLSPQKIVINLTLEEWENMKNRM